MKAKGGPRVQLRRPQLSAHRPIDFLARTLSFLQPPTFCQLHLPLSSHIPSPALPRRTFALSLPSVSHRSPAQTSVTHLSPLTLHCTSLHTPSSHCAFALRLLHRLRSPISTR